jgi:hypothetical protein
VIKIKYLHIGAFAMKLNYLLPKIERDRKCDKTNPNSRTHFWIKTGRIETMFNGNIAVDFVCKYCERRVTSFLTEQEFNTHRKVLEG